MIFLQIIFPAYITYILLAAYVLIVLFTIIRILLDTHSTSKTLAYLLVVIAFPVFGILLYYSFGINYRKKASSRRIKNIYDDLEDEFNEEIPDETEMLLDQHKNLLDGFEPLVCFIKNLDNEYLSANSFKLLTNGEEKFPEILKIMQTARHHIHMEYYAWENDKRGNQIKELLLQKVTEGVKVRIMYDAYASRKIKHNIVKELSKAGVQIYPVIKVKLVGLANRINHRDHRKIIIVDGKIGFVGGINLSDRYDNSIDTGLYWRDTHVKITGPGAMNLQRHFIVNWNACQSDQLKVNDDYFPDTKAEKTDNKPQLSQIIAGGPIYRLSTIMLTYSKLFALAREKLYITNPYFIPNDTILNVLKQAAKSNVDVRLMLPEKSDSAIVGAAAKFYFNELLYAGVKIYLYKKGFVHAKTAIADGKVSIVGTANMDIRSFDLNFEMMSIIYGNSFAEKMENEFLNDLNVCDQLAYDDWKKQSIYSKLKYAVARLISSFL